jgi:ABC-type multidrug transport system ATPase subunit
MMISASNLTEEQINIIQSRYPNSKQRNNELEISGKNLNFKEIIDYLYSQNTNVYSASFKEPTLEDVFIQLTGKELRE